VVLAGEQGSCARAPARLTASLARAAADPIARAVALWIAVVLLAALASGDRRGPALKFAVRMLSGVLLYFAARDLAGSATRARRLVAAIVVAAALSAASTLLETFEPGWSAWWRPFRVQIFSSRARPARAAPRVSQHRRHVLGGGLRCSCSSRPGRRSGGRAGARRLRLAAMILVAALIVRAILASATRGSIFGAALVAALVLVVAGARRLRTRRCRDPRRCSSRRRCWSRSW